MAKKQFKAKLIKRSKRWVCSEGCPNDRVACKHLEKELSKVYARNSVSATPTDFIDKIKANNIEDNRHEHAVAMLLKLRTYALPEIYCQILVCKFVFNWSYAEIADLLCIPSRQTVYETYNKALVLLRERQYE